MLVEELNKKFNQYLDDYQEFLLINHNKDKTDQAINKHFFKSTLFKITILKHVEEERKNQRKFVVIPSLFNSSQILAFDNKNNFLNFLQNYGEVYVVNWLEHDNQVGFEAYINEINRLICTLNEEVEVVGHCIGGAIALAVSQFNEKVKSLTLLTCPWDYSHFQVPIKMAEKMGLNMAMEHCDVIPKIYFKILFFLLFPNQFNEKIEQYFTNDPIKKNKQLQIEYWLQSGISLPKNLYLEIKNQFVLGNALVSGAWRINNSIIDPKHLQIPLFLLAAKNDKIAPAESVRCLKQLLPHAKFIEIEGGHIHYLINDTKIFYQHYNVWLESSLR